MPQAVSATLRSPSGSLTGVARLLPYATVVDDGRIWSHARRIGPIQSHMPRRVRRSRDLTTAVRDRKVDRGTFLTQHLGLVHHVARQLARRLSTEAQVDELVSAGTLGLLHAVDAFDPRRGLAFSTFAVPRIRGAMLDELRRQDHVPRGVRRRAREVMRARHALASELRRAPRESELAARLGVTGDLVRQWERDAEGVVMTSIDQPVRCDVPGTSLGDTLADDRWGLLDESITHEQELAHVRAALEDLRDQERTVLALSYFEELKLHEIATVLGLSVCRVSQIRTAALARLRARLSGLRAA